MQFSNHFLFNETLMLLKSMEEIEEKILLGTRKAHSCLICLLYPLEADIFIYSTISAPLKSVGSLPPASQAAG